MHTTRPSNIVEARFDALFRPLRVNSLELANRIVMAPMTRKFAHGGINAETAVRYYRRRAEGGAALIITEGIATSDLAAHTAEVPQMRTEAQQAIWRQVTQAVHQAGGKIFAQLWHTGLGRLRDEAPCPAELSVGPMATFFREGSPLAVTMGGNTEGLAMTDTMIAATIGEFAQAAADTRACGFDGIELHAAHGYLIDQFLWDETNRRSDRWGGDTAERTRFAVETIRAMRSRVGARFPIGLRFSQWKSPHLYDVQAWPTPARLEAALVPLAEAGLDFLDASTRRYWTPAFSGSELTLAGWARKLTGLPTMAIGSVGVGSAFEATRKSATADPADNLAAALRMMAQDEFDLLGVGRAMIANPDWANLVRDGRLSELRPYDAAALARHD